MWGIPPQDGRIYARDGPKTLIRALRNCISYVHGNDHLNELRERKLMATA